MTVIGVLSILAAAKRRAGARRVVPPGESSTLAR
jgi:hypothetical protein